MARNGLQSRFENPRGIYQQSEGVEADAENSDDVREVGPHAQPTQVSGHPPQSGSLLITKRTLGDVAADQLLATGAEYGRHCILSDAQAGVDVVLVGVGAVGEHLVYTHRSRRGLRLHEGVG